MPETWDIWLPYKEGKESLCRMELLCRDASPTLFSIYHRRFDYEELKPGPKSEKYLKQNPAAEIHVWEGKSYLARNVRSYALNFEYATGKLLYFARCGGDFSRTGFRWSEQLQMEFEGPNITAHHTNAKALARGLVRLLKEGKLEAATIRERERHRRFLSPLEKILER
ncbi:MAG: hypothetical protein AABW53_01540 [Nanoarchaeota archaeon]